MNDLSSVMVAGDAPLAFVCPTPIPVRDKVVLGHGSGGRLSANLLRDVFLPLFANPMLDRMDDQAVIELKRRALAAIRLELPRDPSGPWRSFRQDSGPEPRPARAASGDHPA